MVDAGIDINYIMSLKWTPADVESALIRKLRQAIDPPADSSRRSLKPELVVVDDQDSTATESVETIESTPPAPTGKRRPSYVRNSLWLEWAEEIGLDTPNVEGQVRDKWNESSDDVRAPSEPFHGKIPKGKTGYDRVRKGIGAALEDREKETET